MGGGTLSAGVGVGPGVEVKESIPLAHFVLLHLYHFLEMTLI